MPALQILTFVLGCGLAGSAGLHLLIWTSTHHPSELPESMLFASTWVLIRRYFLLELITMGVGVVLMILPFVSSW